MLLTDQLFLFTGENTFALLEELKRWREGFLEKHGEANLTILNGKTITFPSLLDEVQAAPFLSEKRLILVEEIPTNIDKDNFSELLNAIHESTVLAFIDSAPDKRKSVTKILLKSATVKTYHSLPPKELHTWIRSRAGQVGQNIPEAVITYFLSLVGSDQWHIEQELNKLLCYAATKENESITNADIDNVCLPSEKQAIWRMSELIGKSDATGAVHFATQLLRQGESVHALWNNYLWIVRSIVTLWMWENHKSLPPATLTKETGVPFPTIRSLLPLVRRLPEERMRTIVQRAIEADTALKTGGIKTTTEAPQELVVTLERNIMLFA